MGIQGEALKDCPSCGSRIAEELLRCSYCNTSIGRCTGCQTWIVEGTQCFDCGKSTAIRTRKTTAVTKTVSKVEFEGSPFGLAPLLLVRTAFAAAFLYLVACAIVVSPFGKVTEYVARYIAPLKVPMPTLWIAAGVALLLTGFAGHLIRRWRWRNTSMFGQSVEVSFNPGSVIKDLLILALVLPLTAGLGVSWVYARFRLSFFRSCWLPGRGNRRLDFQGTGEDVLGRFFGALLLLPLGIASGGLLLGLISYMWMKWELTNTMVPDRNGKYHAIQYKGGFWGYQGRWMMNWILSVATAGLYRPFAKCMEWKWVAKYTAVP